ncbi:hypothetical protein AC578_5105 [Pseudocercospora eumusae]|uniref:Uncharacterized protein n=1 Tax=Pseudocercospora eumusae TaxID=321146 RepID=A0A139HIN2_9PEZI|nr:hypothetical protein AC578_5105 [Pseudocercospora eumusae]
MRWSKSEKFGWFRDLHGRPFVLDLRRMSQSMEEIDADALVLERTSSYSGNPDPSKLIARTLHSDRVTTGLPPLQFADQSMEKAIEEAGMLIYSTSWYGLPLPPAHWVPNGGPGLIDDGYQCWAFIPDDDYQIGRLMPVAVVDVLDQNFGCWIFEQHTDYSLAVLQGFKSAQGVILAAFSGKSGLQNMLECEFSEGSGVCCTSCKHEAPSCTVVTFFDYRFGSAEAGMPLIDSNARPGR